MLRARCLFPARTSLCPQLNQNTQTLGRLQIRSSCLIMDFPCCLGEGMCHGPAVIARATIFIQGNQGKMSFTSGVISTSVWTHHCKGSSPTSAQAEEYHLGTALKDTSNRSTIILHVSILKPSDLISLPVKKEQETGLSLHAVP